MTNLKEENERELALEEKVISLLKKDYDCFSNSSKVSKVIIGIIQGFVLFGLMFLIGSFIKS